MMLTKWLKNSNLNLIDRQTQSNLCHTSMIYVTIFVDNTRYMCMFLNKLEWKNML